ncbi:MAG: hypothetical protein JXA54_01125 [Candidatus Heimdallarchaeota archaeon]|nr:hypothetical protein [Candidatus Heimdallarchaeota archaeon]
MHFHEKIDVKVNDSFIEKFAKKYIEQRSKTNFDLNEIDSNLLYKANGFDATLLEGIIKKNAVAHDFAREKGKQPEVLRDIYRSDLGELLMTYYFEEKIDTKSRFIIPLKNITYRERSDLPGRGLDAIGYRVDEDKISILLGEAKVSDDQKSPPAVVDKNKDSIYRTHKKHNDKLDVVIERLTDYCRRLGAKDAEIVGLVILCMESNKKDLYSLTFGSTLIRDFKCVNDQSDFGKLKTNVNEFSPNKIHFSIISFKEKQIRETVDLFYDKVQELIK